MPGSDEGPLTTAARAATAEIDDAAPQDAVAVYERLQARLAEALDGSARSSGPAAAAGSAGAGG